MQCFYNYIYHFKIDITDNKKYWHHQIYPVIWLFHYYGKIITNQNQMCSVQDGKFLIISVHTYVRQIFLKHIPESFEKLLW